MKPGITFSWKKAIGQKRNNKKSSKVNQCQSTEIIDDHFEQIDN